jgi:molybdate transport system regulatory protein
MEEQLQYKMTIKLWKKEKVFGPGVMELLEQIEKFGSLQKATDHMGLAYSKGWKMLRTSEKELGFPLTTRLVGGKDGGGSVVTEQGKEMMRRYAAFEKEAKAQVDALFFKYFSPEEKG